MSEVVKLTIVSESSEHTAEPSPKVLTVGEKLASARKNLDLTIEQVAGQLKWSSRQISEIEAGNYSVFPDMLTVRGFVRTYAKILKIDSTSLMHELANELEKLPSKQIDRPKLDTPFPTGRMPILGRHHNNSQKFLGAVILLLLCIVMLVVYRAEIQKLVHAILPAQSDKIAASPANSAIAEVPALQPAATPADSAPSPGAGKPEEKELTVAEYGANSNQNPAAVTSQQERVVIAKTNQATESLKPAAAQNEQVRQGGLAQSGTTSIAQAVGTIPEAESLRFEFKQDSWIQVKSASGSVIASQLYRAGSEEVFRVNQPLNIVIGNAPGVVVTLRGDELVLPLQPGSNVVNLSIK